MKEGEEGGRVTSRPVDAKEREMKASRGCESVYSRWDQPALHPLTYLPKGVISSLGHNIPFLLPALPCHTPHIPFLHPPRPPPSWRGCGSAA